MRIRQLAVPAIIGLLVAFGAGPAFAQELDRTVVGDVPTGTFHYAAATFSNSPLWDITGTYESSGSSNGVSGSATFILTSSAAGAISGSVTEIFSGATFTLTDVGTVSGKVSELSTNVTICKLKTSGVVTGTTRGTAKGSGIVTVIKSNLTISVDEKETLALKHFGSITFHNNKTSDLPGGVTGDWTLTIISTNVDTFEGLGIITLYDGLALTNTLSGSYNSTTGEAKLKLTGEGANKGVSLSLTTTNGAAMDLATLSGKVLGQKPVYP
jgi:hypothetical protein